MFQLRKDAQHPTHAVHPVRCAAGFAPGIHRTEADGRLTDHHGGRRSDSDRTRRKARVLIVVVVQRETNLFEMILALRPPRGLASVLHGGQQHRNQDGDDRHHDQ